MPSILEEDSLTSHDIDSLKHEETVIKMMEKLEIQER